MTKHVILILLTIVIFLRPLSGFSYEREIIIGEEYQTKRETKLLKRKFRFNLSVSTGFCYAQEVITSGKYELLPPEYKTYLEKLNMKFSSNPFTIGFTVTYIITPRMGVYFSIPFGLVKVGTRLCYVYPPGRFAECDKIAVGIGDIFGGVYYQLLKETNLLPSLTVYFEVYSPLAKYTSLGDGVWDLVGGLDVRKILIKPFYLCGLFVYINKLPRNHINPGDIIRYGGGIGILRRNRAIEIDVIKSDIGSIKMMDYVLLEKDTDLELMLRFDFFGIKSREGSLIFRMAGLDEGWNWKLYYFGIELRLSF